MIQSKQIHKWQVAMEQERFVKTGNDSFYGDYLYDQVIPADHFLRKHRQIIEWERFTRKLIKLYKGEGVVGGHPLIRHWCSKLN